MIRHKWSDKNFHMRRRFEPKVVDFCNNCTGRVLDLGCGTQPFKQYLSDSVYIGLDYSSIEDGVRGDALSLPFKNKSFDHILSTQVIEHVPDPFQFFSEVSRVLKSNGSTFITTNMMWNIHMGPNDYFRFTRFGLQELADRFGLSVIDILEVGTIPMRLCQKLNDAYNYILPDKIIPSLIAITNGIFYPILDIDTHEDYIITGVEARKSERDS